MVLIKGTRIQGVISVQQTDSIEWLNIFGFGVTHKETSGSSLAVYLNEEEAIYLLIKCHLVLFDENDVIVTVETLLAEKSSQFLVKCKVYSYFKDRNFIVRAGINFGVDYTVYRSLPHLCHSEYCVLAMDCTEGNETVAESGFRYLTAQSRTMSDVMKLFLLCYATTATSATTVTSSSTIPQQDHGMSQLEKLSHLIVRPVCVTVRRAMAVTMQYESTQDAQKRISIVSWNKKPNQGGEKWTRAPTAIAHQMNNKSKVEHEDISQSIPTASTAAGPSSKKMKVRRDPNEVRIKGSSKYAKLWKNLKKPVTENESDS